MRPSRSARVRRTPARCSTCAAQPAASAQRSGSRRAAEVIVAAARGWIVPAATPAPDAGSISSGASPARSRATRPPTDRTRSGRYGGTDARASLAVGRVAPILGQPDRVRQRPADASRRPADVRWTGAASSCDSRPRSSSMPCASASSARLAATTIGRPRSRQASTSGRCSAEVAGVDDRQDCIGSSVQEELPERRQPVAAVGERVGSGQVDQDGVAAAEADLRAASLPTVVPGTLAASS